MHCEKKALFLLFDEIKTQSIHSIDATTQLHKVRQYVRTALPDLEPLLAPGPGDEHARQLVAEFGSAALWPLCQRQAVALAAASISVDMGRHARGLALTLDGSRGPASQTTCAFFCEKRCPVY